MTTNDKIKNIVLRGKTLGLKSLVIASKEGDNLTYHFEDIKISDAMTLTIGLFHQVIMMNIEKTPNMSEERKKAFGDLTSEFGLMIQKHSEILKRLP